MHLEVVVHSLLVFKSCLTLATVTFIVVLCFLSPQEFADWAKRPMTWNNRGNSSRELSPAETGESLTRQLSQDRTQIYRLSSVSMSYWRFLHAVSVKSNIRYSSVVSCVQIHIQTHRLAIGFIFGVSWFGSSSESLPLGSSCRGQHSRIQA